MRALLPVVAAGTTFAGAALLGLFAGMYVAARTGKAACVPLGLAVGAVVGGYSALRLIQRAMR